ncbi:hypothetical protein E4U42_002330 [Claviceps africana]|uniref:Uncharacterized protein n=1 Tax=Claviceps africana TaxID=83212 RepID=A0A8K0J8X0_9HYPO|nr:hypothetical protein E4U42_002330 [Claviceps africana]
MEYTLQGQGIHLVDAALASLVQNPERLHHARMRFSRSPPVYVSPQGATTVLASPDAAEPEEVRQKRQREERRFKREYYRHASRPCEQLAAEWMEELARLRREALSGTLRVPAGTMVDKFARDTVKRRWEEQGIWDDKWGFEAGAHWKHEEPLNTPPPRRPGGEVVPARDGLSGSASENKDTEAQAEAEQWPSAPSPEGIRAREASRPFYQFIYQVSKERERITGQQSALDMAADINTTAYENVKKVWRGRHIWNPKWGLLPGMTWTHEHPLGEEENEDPEESQSLDGGDEIDSTSERPTPGASFHRPAAEPDGSRQTVLAATPPNQQNTLSPSYEKSVEPDSPSPADYSTTNHAYLQSIGPVAESPKHRPVSGFLEEAARCQLDKQEEHQEPSAPSRQTTPESVRDEAAVEGTPAPRPTSDAPAQATTCEPGKKEEHQDNPSPTRQTSPEATHHLQSSAAAQAASSPAKQAPIPETTKTSNPRSRRKRKITDTELDGDAAAPTSFQPRRSKRTCIRAKDQPEPASPKLPAPKKRQTRAAGTRNAPPDASVKSRAVAKRRSTRKKRAA